MAEENSKNKVKVRSFNYKWYEFLIVYGIINILFFFSISAGINNIYENFSKLFVSEALVDGADFSIFVNLFAAPIFLFLLIANIGIIVLQEFIVILIFKLVYFKSIVSDDEKTRLYQRFNITLLFLILANIIGIIFSGDLKRIILFVLIYFPIPLITFEIICCKVKIIKR